MKILLKLLEETLHPSFYNSRKIGKYGRRMFNHPTGIQKGKKLDKMLQNRFEKKMKRLSPKQTKNVSKKYKGNEKDKDWREESRTKDWY